MINSNKPDIDFAKKEYIVSQQTGIFPLVQTGGTYQNVGVGLTLTIQKTGLYKITCKTHADITYTTNNQNSAVLRLARNGTEITGTVTQPYKNTAAIAGSFVFPVSIEAPLQMLTAGDIITLQGYKTNTDVLNVFANALYQGFIQAELISAFVNTVPSMTDPVMYVPEITADTTNPTKGTIVIDAAYWQRVGKYMHIKYDYQQSAPGTNGNGYYSIGMPPGYQIDTTIQTLTTYKAVGYGMGYSTATAEYALIATAKTTTTFGILRQSTTLAWVGSAVLSLGVVGITLYSLDIRVPILGW